MNGWYITSTGGKVILEPPYSIAVARMDLIELVIPDGAIDVECFGNNLTKLIIPDSVKYIRCWDNNLTELIIPDQVKYINCRNNKLTELVVPDGCRVNCDESVNQINKTMYNRSNRLKNILK
jgi:hypothetical protein